MNKIGTYGACRYAKSTTIAINEWMKEVSIPNLLDPSKIHTTIIFSRTHLEEKFLKPILSIKLKGLYFTINGFELFDSDHPDFQSLVAVLNAPKLCEIHQQLRECGATCDYLIYHPHITLSYKVPKTFMTSTLKIPSILLIPSEIYFEPLDLNWSA